MKILSAYITKQVMGSVFVVWLFFVGLDYLLALMEQLDNLNQQYTLGEAVIFTLFKVPTALYFYLPTSVLLGVLISLGFMANSSELTIFRSAGLSLVRIYGMVLRPILLLAFLSLLLAQVIIPWSEREAVSFQNQAKGRAVLNVKSGIWQRDGLNFYHIQTVRSNGELRGFSRFQFNKDGQLQQTAYAEQARYIDGKWHVFNNKSSSFVGDRVLTDSVTALVIEANLSPELFQRLSLAPSKQAPMKLWQYMHQLKQQGERADEYELEFWRKIFQPFVIAVMVLIALSFIFGPLRSVTTGVRIVTGVVAGLLYTYTQEFCVQAGLVYQLSPFISISIPILAFFGLGLLLFRRAA